MRVTSIVLVTRHCFGGKDNLMRINSSKYYRRLSVLAVAASAILAILLVPQSGDSHTPITTKVMFNKEIARIFQRNCVACHSDSSITGIPLVSYAQSRPWAKAIEEEVLERRMPPNQPAKGFGNFLNDNTLSQRDIDLIVSWVEGGAPKGDDKDFPAAADRSTWKLGPPDLVLQPEREIKITATGDDENQCVVLSTGQNSDRWLKAIDFHPGNDSVVHSASFEIDRSTKSQMLELTGQTLGSCGSPAESADRLGSWFPGQTSIPFPPSAARLLPAGARILMRVRYHKTGQASVDKSSLALYFTKEKAAGSLSTIAISAPETNIAAGVENYRIRTSHTVAETTEIVAIRPTLFPFLKSLEATAYKPDGTVEVLFWATNYRYDWQPEFRFKYPVSLPKGTRIQATAYVDNSDNNPDNPNSPAKALKFAPALCELSLVKVDGGK